MKNDDKLKVGRTVRYKEVIVLQHVGRIVEVEASGIIKGIYYDNDGSVRSLDIQKNEDFCDKYNHKGDILRVGIKMIVR